MTLLIAAEPNKLEQFSSNFWRISVERYHEMINVGTLTENDRLELLEGFLIEKMTVNPPHTFVTEMIRDLLADIIPGSFFVNSQQPITMSDSEPEPDVIVVHGTRRDFLKRHPRPENVALVVEVSDSTLNQDQNWKKRIYARAGIPAYWIVNLPDRQIELYTQPSGPTSSPTYHQLTTYHEEDVVPVFLDEKQIATLSVRELLP